jgi:hypothetical protein
MGLKRRALVTRRASERASLFLCVYACSLVLTCWSGGLLKISAPVTPPVREAARRQANSQKARTRTNTALAVRRCVHATNSSHPNVYPSVQKSRPCGIFALLIHSKFLFFLAGWLCAPTNGKFSNSVPSEIKRWNKLERTQTGGAQIVKRKLCFLPRWLSSFFGFESSD